MAILLAAFVVGLALHSTLCNAASSTLSTTRAENSIEPFSWEVDVFPDQAPHILNGTIEQVHAQLHRLNPLYRLFSQPSSSASSTVAVRTRVDRRQQREKYFPDDPISHLPIDMHTGRPYEAIDVECNRFRQAEANCDNIVHGIEHLTEVPYRPVNGPGPGNCGRVSCSYGAAIFWCNDNPEPFTLPSFDVIAQAVHQLLSQCGRCGFRPLDGKVDQGYEDLTMLAASYGSGQIFYPDKWNVIVRHDDKDC